MTPDSKSLVYSAQSETAIVAEQAALATLLEKYQHYARQRSLLHRLRSAGDCGSFAALEQAFSASHAQFRAARTTAGLAILKARSIAAREGSNYRADR